MEAGRNRELVSVRRRRAVAAKGMKNNHDENEGELGADGPALPTSQLYLFGWVNFFLVRVLDVTMIHTLAPDIASLQPLRSAHHPRCRLHMYDNCILHFVQSASTRAERSDNLAEALLSTS